MIEGTRISSYSVAAETKVEGFVGPDPELLAAHANEAISMRMDVQNAFDLETLHVRLNGLSSAARRLVIEAHQRGLNDGIRVGQVSVGLAVSGTKQGVQHV